MEVKKSFITLIFLMISLLIVIGVPDVAPEQFELCQSYEAMVRFETSTIVNQIEKTKQEFATHINGRVNEYENKLMQIIYITGKTVMTYMVVGIFAVVFLSGSVFSLIMLRSWKKILLSLSDEINQLSNKVKEMNQKLNEDKGSN